MNNKYKILVIEDESAIRGLLTTVLEAQGYQVLGAAGLAQGSMMFYSHRPDLIILDLGLPDGDGMHLIRTVRGQGSVPIIVLSARTDEPDKVNALDLGANDYMTKPFGTAELVARVRVALRNAHNMPEGVAFHGGKFAAGDLLIDYDSRTVSMGGKEVRFTQTEYNILAFMAQYAGKMLTYSNIIRAVWGEKDAGGTKKLQVNMTNIRKKLSIRPGDNSYIINELGVGYRMVEGNDGTE